MPCTSHAQGSTSFCVQTRVLYTKLLNFDLFTLVVIVLNSLRVNGRLLLVHAGQCVTQNWSMDAMKRKQGLVALVL